MFSWQTPALKTSILMFGWLNLNNIQYLHIVLQFQSVEITTCDIGDVNTFIPIR